MTFTATVGVANRKLYCSKATKQMYPLTIEGCKQLAKRIVEAADGLEIIFMRSSSLDDLQMDDNDYAQIISEEIDTIVYGPHKTALSIFECGKCQKFHTLTSNQCKEPFDSAQHAANQLNRPVRNYNEDIITFPDFPESIKQEYLVCVKDSESIIVILKNGTLTLNKDKSWVWIETPSQTTRP